jgi:O-methyltransferase involved in polyketide biosynthesis
MTDSSRESKKKWDLTHSQIIRKSKARYDANHPVWSFRPSQEIREWLEEERWDNQDGDPESNAQLVTRKLKKLMNREYI